MKYIKQLFRIFFYCTAFAQQNGTYVKYLLKNGGKEVSVTCFLSDNRLLVPVEDFADFSGLSYEICPRCGNTAIIKKSFNKKDVLLVEWNSPYVYYQNTLKKITLPAVTRRSGNKTYCDPSLFGRIGVRYEQDKIHHTFQLH